MDNDSLIQWLEAMIAGLGRGGKSKASKNLGIGASGISKYLSRGKGFHNPTVRLMSWILSSKSENFPETKVLSATKCNQILIEKRRASDGDVIYTWRRA